MKNLKVGSSYEIDINIGGRAWKDRNFISLKAWKVKELEASPDNTDQSGDGMPF